MVDWTPASLPSLAGWWDADDATTFTYSSGVVVSQWRDKSGNGRHLAQGGTGAQPTRSGTINGRSSVVFDGTDDQLMTDSLSRTKPHTILVVARNTAASGQRTLIVAATDGRVFRTSGGTIDTYQGSFLSSGASWGTTDAHSAVVVLNDASSKIAVDSEAWVTGDAGSAGFATSAWSVGAYYNGGEFWQGDICEIVCADVSISDADKDSWFAYAATKWGTPGDTVPPGLTPADSVHAHASDSPALTQAHELAPADCTHAHTTETPTVAQVHALAPADTLHTHVADSPLVFIPSGLPPPVERTVVTPPEVRILAVAAETRIITTPAETRIITD